MGQSNHPRSRFGQGGFSMYAALVLVLAGLGMGLRIDDLDRKSLWGDEVFTIERATQPSVADTIQNVKNSPFPPGYYIFLRIWLRFVGLSDVTLRLPAMALGVLVLPATYLAWYPLLGRRASLWAIALLSLNAFHIWYSSDAKMYSLIWILSTLSSASFLRILLGLPRWPVWCVVYGVCNAALPLVSYVGIVPLMVQVAFAIVILIVRPELRRMLSRLAMINGLSIIPFLFWLPIAFEAATHRTGIGWIPAATFNVFAELYRLFGMFLLGYQISENPSPPPDGPWWYSLSWIYGPCVVGAAILLLFDLIKSMRAGKAAAPNGSFDIDPEGNTISGRQTDPTVVWYLALWLLLPMVEALSFSLTVYSLWGVPRYLTASAPALTLWLASALGSARLQPLSRILGVLILAANIQVIAFDRSHTTRIPWREVAGTLRDVATTHHISTPHAKIHGDVHKPLEVNVLRTDDLLNFKSLEHALGRVAPSVEVFDNTSFFDPIGIEAFFVLHRLPGSRDAANLPTMRGPRPTPGFTAHLIRSDTVYEDRFSAAPKPFGPTTLELWLYLADVDQAQALRKAP